MSTTVARFREAIIIYSGTVINSGTITVYRPDNGRDAVRFGAGSLTNLSTGLIESGTGGNGVGLSGLGTVTNSGTIIGLSGLPYGNAVELRAGGYVDNSGILNGADHGVYVLRTASGTITNSGTIEGSADLAGGGTVIDSGTIVGGTAVSFGGTIGGSGSNLLVLEAGYYLSGTVLGSTTVGATNTLELSGTLGTVTATYNTLGLTNFQDVLFGAGGSETLKANTTTGTLGTVTLSGWTQTSEIVDLTQIGSNATLANGGTVTGAHRLTASGSGGTVVLQLDATDATVFTISSDGVTGADITPACFRRGTLIWSARGEVAVEDLAIGAARAAARLLRPAARRRPGLASGASARSARCRAQLLNGVESGRHRASRRTSRCRERHGHPSLKRAAIVAGFIRWTLHGSVHREHLGAFPPALSLARQGAPLQCSSSSN